MKTVILAAALAALATSAMAASDAPEGRLIGDGKTLPREFVPGKTGQQRASEIWKWMSERGATHSARACITAQKLCIESMNLPLANGSVLTLQFRDYYNGRPDYWTYCREAATHDTLACYNMLTGDYYANMKDADSGKWQTIWNSADDEKTPSTAPTRPASDIEM